MLGQFDRKFYIDFLRDIDEAEMSGILRLRQNRILKALFFESGCLVFGISNLPDEELGQHLVNTGELTNEHLESLKQHINRTQPLTFLLQAYNLVNHEKLVKAEYDLISSMAITCFNWETGEYTFDSSKTADHEFKIQIRALDILANGIRNLQDTNYIYNAIGDLTQYVLPVTDLFNRTKRLSLTPQEGYILSLIDTAKTVSHLISSSGLAEIDVLKTLYVLLATGVLDPLEETIDIRTSVKLANASGNPIKAVPVSAPTASLPRASGAYRKLSPLDQTYSSLQTAQAQAQPVMQAQPAVQAQAVPQTTQTYQTGRLDQPQPAKTNKINTAKLEALAGIKIRSSTGAKDSQENEQAEQLFIQGKQLLRTGDLRKAEIAFRQAIDLSPDTAKYLLALSLILVKRSTSRKEAEGLLIKCCELESSAIEPRLQLASIYEQSNMPSKAEQMYKSILNIDPENAVAKEKLKKNSSIWNADVGSIFSKILKK